MTLPTPVSDITDCFLEEVDARLPDRLTGLFLHGSICWGEFFPGSDIDFVGLWDRLPADDDLEVLRAAHESTRQRFPTPAFDGFHCTAADLSVSPSAIPHRPVFYREAFDPEGTVDINPVTWQELSERAVVIRGPLPSVRTDLDELVEFTRRNLDTYWRDLIKQIEDTGAEAVGGHDDVIAWVGLGAARLHHLLVTKELTSKSGAGRYVCESLDPRWDRIGREALRVREDPGSRTLYDDPAQRGRDLHDLLTWLVRDGTGRTD